MDHEERLAELEKRYCFQEELLQTLNQTVVSQQNRIDELEKRLKLLSGRLRDLSDSMEKFPQQERPPHY